MADSFFHLRHNFVPVVCRPPAFSQVVTQAEVMKVLQKTGPIKCTDLMAKFRKRIETSEDKAAFAAVLKKISRIQKTDGADYIVIRAPNQGVTEAEVMRVFQQTKPMKSTDLVAKFRNRLKSSEDKMAFAAILKKISRLEKTDGGNYVVLRAQQ